MEFYKKKRPLEADLAPAPRDERYKVRRWKATARAFASLHQALGGLTPQACEGCGSALVEKHHEGYARPLDVRWLCRRCHNIEHAAVRAALRLEAYTVALAAARAA